MNSYYHAKSSAKKWGGEPDEYQPIHDFIDSSKRIFGDVRHRAVYHHTEGCFLAERIFGTTITNSRGVEVPTRLVAERHIIEDLGWLPSPADYLRDTPIAAWMSGSQKKDMDLSTLGLRPREICPNCMVPGLATRHEFKPGQFTCVKKSFPEQSTPPATLSMDDIVLDRRAH